MDQFQTKPSSDCSLLQFPWKLHALLEACAEQNEPSISWLPGGKSFQVHDKAEFSTRIMPTFFKSAVYKSFQRNLNLWGWKTVSKEAGRAIYHHEFFVRGQPGLCHQMSRGQGVTKVQIGRATSDSSVAIDQQDPSRDDRTSHISSSLELQRPAAVGSSAFQAVHPRMEELDPNLVVPTWDSSARSSQALEASVQDNLIAEAIKNAPASVLIGLINSQGLQGMVGSMFAAQSLLQSQLHLAHMLTRQQNEQYGLAAAALGGMSSALEASSHGSASRHTFQTTSAAETNECPTYSQSSFRPLDNLLKAEAGKSEISEGNSQVQERRPKFPPRKRKHSSAQFEAPSREMERCSTIQPLLPISSAVAAHDTDGSQIDIVPCRARAMPLDHNSHTAFFEINRADIVHGTDLICSHPTCRNGGAKFRYCSICKVPASKRTFSYFHAHRDDTKQAQDGSKIICSSVSTLDGQDPKCKSCENSADSNFASSTTTNLQSSAPSDGTDSGGARQYSCNLDPSSLDNDNYDKVSRKSREFHQSEQNDTRLGTAWENLLLSRRRQKTSDDALESWVETVLKVSSLFASSPETRLFT